MRNWNVDRRQRRFLEKLGLGIGDYSHDLPRWFFALHVVTPAEPADGDETADWAFGSPPLPRERLIHQNDRRRGGGIGGKRAALSHWDSQRREIAWRRDADFHTTDALVGMSYPLSRKIGVADQRQIVYSTGGAHTGKAVQAIE